MRAEGREARQSEEILQHLVQLAPLLKKAIPLDATIAVTDTEKYLCTLPFGDSMDSRMNGKPLRDGDPVNESMKKKEPLFKTVDAKVFGFAFKASGTPIFDDDGRVIGGLGIGISLENQQKLHEMAENLAGMYEKLVPATEELSTSAQDLSSIMETLADVQREMMAQFRNTDQILNMIHSVSETTKLLGLNAAIEAARAGEHGRGFAVVANEIRKLADESSSSVKKIRELLGEMKMKVDRLNDTVQKVTRISSQQTASSEEVSASIQELKAVVHNIQHVARVV
jgi:K+-transporting ATPase c subunit